LWLDKNALAGPIPQSFLQLDRLRLFQIEGNKGLCVPGTSVFVAWLREIANPDDESESMCNAADIRALMQLHEATGGSAWIEADGWTSDGAVGDWYGVTADSLGQVTELDLTRNGLAGQLPPNMGDLNRMTQLRIGGNALGGRLPLSMTRIPLREFRYADTELCVPAGALFQAWLNGISTHEGTGSPCAPLSDREVLETLYQATGGLEWTRSENWLTDAPLGEWYGVWTDGQGRVTTLQLIENNLTGHLPAEFGSLDALTWLALRNNKGLTGPIPPELAGLASLTFLSLNDNALSGPIPAELGDLASLEQLSLWGNNHSGPIPPELGRLAELQVLRLASNPLEGPIPPELGNLSKLHALHLFDNALTGSIPGALGRLGGVEAMLLWGNALTGAIPPELGNLAGAEVLSLRDNALSGPIPPELGKLGSVTYLDLADNALTGPVPGGLASLSTVESLILANNDLSGPIPPEFGAMAALQELALTNNPRMEGALPSSLTELRHVEALLAGSTDLCAPTEPGFQAWLEGIHRRRIAPCVASARPAAYLTQAVQSREFPVPLVAGERALLRVFPTARQANSAGIPPVRARFFVNGTETHVENIAGRSTAIPTKVYEGSLSKSANADIPESVIQPGLEMVIEVDPDGTLDPALGVATRIPETGRLPADVRAMPLFDLTLIPFIWSQDPDSSIVELITAMAADPENHEMLGATRTLLPIADLVVTAHEPVLSSSNSAFAILDETKAIRAMEGGAGYYMGMMAGPVTGAAGVAFLPGRVSFSQPRDWTMAHELGHNMNLQHAPCRGTPGSDSSYPYTGGLVGAWGYDFEGGRLVSPSTPDLMAYCSPRWISDYQFSNALRYRLFDEKRPTAAAVAERSLLLWGGVNAQGEPHLRPAFVVDAPALLPDSAGEHRMTGRTSGGAQLFSFSFTMPETADGDGSSSFAFILPARSGWEGNLASITLTGPGGSATLDADSNEPMVILRNPRNGQVRGFLRGPLPATWIAADALGQAAGPELETLFSRGVPGADAWRR